MHRRRKRVEEGKAERRLSVKCKVNKRFGSAQNTQKEKQKGDRVGVGELNDTQIKKERGALEREGVRGILQRSSGISETLICCRYAARRAAVSRFSVKVRFPPEVPNVVNEALASTNPPSSTLETPPKPVITPTSTLFFAGEEETKNRDGGGYRTEEHQGEKKKIRKAQKGEARRLEERKRYRLMQE
ncbi:hypothetical protein K1719_024143 [Acacia pycnantha]|nr:hypothetical protein K1719_024143 [Acacia pycnantha]